MMQRGDERVGFEARPAWHGHMALAMMLVVWVTGCAAPFGDRNGTDTSGAGSSESGRSPAHEGHGGGHHH